MNSIQEDYSLEKLAKFTLSHPEIIKNISRMITYNDEPKVFTYIAYYETKEKSVTDSSSGTSFYQRRALIKTIGEAIERYCLDTEDDSKLTTAPVSELRSAYVDPISIPSFSKKQMSDKVFKQFKISHDTKFRWIEGYSYVEKKTILLPAQLVFTNYQLLPNEPFIRFPVSTGGAAYTSLESALYRGICEAIERDSFMLYYLNKISPPKIDISVNKDQELKNIMNVLNRYKLELTVFDISTDLEIPVYAAFLLDRTEKGPAVSLGLKAGFDGVNGIFGAIEEALMTRSWIRDEFIYKKKEFILPPKIETMSQRAYFWLKTEMIQRLDFLFKGNTFKQIERINHKSEKSKLHTVAKLLKKAHLDIYYVDITQRKIKEAGFTVVKVFIPKLYPVYFDEKYPYLGIPRLYEVPVKLGFVKKSKTEGEINPIPHPFL